MKRTIEPRGPHHIGDEERWNHSGGASVNTSDTSRRQEIETDDVYGDLPVLREHQYGDIMASGPA